MNIIAIDASGAAGSVAYIKSGKLAGEYYFCDKLTHSQTIMLMLESLKQMIGINLEKVDAVAVTAGPGSFTGLRIGVTAAKVLALSLNVPIIGIPTLDVIANGVTFTDNFICPIMDARRNQVYTALYKYSDDGNGKVERITDYMAIDMNEYIEDIIARAQETNKKVIFLGDGVDVYKDKIVEALGSYALFMPKFINLQHASVLACMAVEEYEKGNTEDPDLFVPMYLRKSQAEREKEEREAVAKAKEQQA